MRSLLPLSVLLCIFLGLPLQAHAAAISRAQTDGYSVVGPPTISVALINQILAAAHSPAAGKGQALFDDGLQYGIDPVYALAFFMHESAFGTTGEARVSLSLGNLRCIAKTLCRDGYAWFPSWEAGFNAWYRLILYGYLRGQVTLPLVGHTCVTLEQIIPVYAPAGDHNNVAAYIHNVETIVDQWRNQQKRLPHTSSSSLPPSSPPPADNPPGTRVISPSQCKKANGRAITVLAGPTDN